MSDTTISRTRLATAAAALALVAGGIGFGIARLEHTASAPSGQTQTDQRKILYWYDPMIPAEHHDGPGLSSMGMKLIPRYADEGGSANVGPGVTIDPGSVQRLGARIVPVERGTLTNAVTVTGSIDFNERNLAVIQSRSAAFVQRVYARAPGDVVPAGAPLADLLVPEWAGARAEYEAVRRTGDAALARAARQRMALLGMTGATGGRTTIRAPIGGVIKTLSVRQGMTWTMGQTLAEVNGLRTVWLNAAVPEATMPARVRVGTPVAATLVGFSRRETFAGRIAAILPQAQAETRTLTVRIELANKRGQAPARHVRQRRRLGQGFTRQAARAQRGRDPHRSPNVLVMLANSGGRFRPAEVRTGAEGGGERPKSSPGSPRARRSSRPASS
jgi:membrane fusion protein, copper/silver efflux system